MNAMGRLIWGRRLGFCLLVWVGLSLAVGEVAVAAKPKLSLTKVGWSAKQNKLIINGKLKNASASSPIEVFDINGRRLGTASGTKAFKFNTSDLTVAPCSVRVVADNLDAVKAVAGAPKSCAKTPTCNILQPLNGAHFDVNTDVTFTAQSGLRDQNGGPLKLEWDFAGGAMGEVIDAKTNPPTYKRPDTNSTTVQFVRNNGRYRVRFSAMNGALAAMEGEQQRCEDALEVVIGTPPDTLPDFRGTLAKVRQLAAEAQAAAPKPGNQLAGRADDLVVMPYEDWSMQNAGDMRLVPNTYSSFEHTATSLNAVVYQKAFQPKLLTPNEAQLSYSAASNPADPVGADSINATSQNWPLNAPITVASPLMQAKIQKTDAWETNGGEHNLWEAAFSYDSMYNPARPPVPDEGYEGPSIGTTQGSTMSGISNPYQANEPQSVGQFDAIQKAFNAKYIPVTDIDDSGRVNPYPLFRFQVKQGDKTAVADAVLSNSRDQHCRECHEKGFPGKADGIAANVAAPYTQAAFHSSTLGQYQETHPWGTCNDRPAAVPDKPEFIPAASDSLFDRDYAASWNYSSIHDYYDNQCIINFMEGNDGQSAAGTCSGCHGSDALGLFTGGWIQTDPRDINDLSSPNFWPLYSIAEHRFHAQMMWNDQKNGIQRLESGKHKRWDYTQGPNPSSLYPVKDGNGASIAMEQNCLKCHAGKREQLYRDRMYTAGVTCYDCHGDMLAVGTAHPAAGQDSTDPTRRVNWFGQPDCGSCHTGDANTGKDASNGYFSAGVMKRAFDDNNWSATTRQPDNLRFAVMPRNPDLELDFAFSVYNASADKFSYPPMKQRVTTPLFRVGKDTHGDVPCGACHGAAHAIWPNRDPSANDNVTALQLQGHTGNILECNVCHTADSFADKTHIDAGRFMSTKVDSGILGGPHNLHPVNDPNWYKADSLSGHAPNADGTTYGGWHNVYAKIAGADGEDQCAACHGSDHKGTRMSRTPVDRVFDFRGFKFAKLKKVGFKKAVIKVPAGSFIGCNTCHNITTSCTKSPNQTCGQPSAPAPAPANHLPTIISAAPTVNAVVGQEYSYPVEASDSDQGDNLAFRLNYYPVGMSIDEQSHRITWTPDNKIGYAPTEIPYSVEVSDGKGGVTHQEVRVKVVCPDGQAWTNDPDMGGMCM